MANVSQSTSNLDISKLAQDDYNGLAETINSFYKQDASAKLQLAWHWERNQLMLDGKQWLTFEGEAATGGQWKQLRVSRNNEYIPRPVTNYLFDAYQTLKSYLIKQKPRSVVKPNTATYRDKSAAKIATMILEGNWARLKEQFNYETAAANLIAYGTVFKKSYWDTSSLSMVKVPRMVDMPQTDPQTGQVIGIMQVEDRDPQTGEVLFDELPLGDVATTVLEPYRISLDPLAMHLHEARWIMETSIQSLEWIKETYMREGEGFTGLAAEVEEEKDLNNSMRKWFQLRTTSGTRSQLLSAGSASSDEMIDNAAVVKDYYERPSARYPKGRLVVIAGTKCVYSGPSPCEGPEMGDWHPYSECRWELVPGRFWGKSPLDNGVELQKQINAIDSAIILTRKTMAMPQKLIPLGNGIAQGTWTGRPGQEIFYRADGTGAMPTTIPSAGVNEQVFVERKQKVDDIKTITGAIDILKGDRPQGVNAASAINMLYEVGTGKLFPVLDRWKMFIEEDQKKQLRLIGKKYKEPRPQFIQMLMMHNSELSPEAISAFIGTDLFDNFNVCIEAGSNIPKLESAKDARKMELAQMGVLNLQDPVNRSHFLADMGIDGYDIDVGPDQKRAEWENDVLDNSDHAPGNQPVVLAVDNHAVHIACHSARMKAPAFMSLSAPVQQAYMQHIQQHEQFQQMAMQAQMLNEQAMAPAPGAAPRPQQGGPAGTPAGPPIARSKASPISGDVHNAIHGSDILPASLGTK